MRWGASERRLRIPTVNQSSPIVERRQGCMWSQKYNRNVRRSNDVRGCEGLRVDAIELSYFPGAWRKMTTYSSESWVNDSSRRFVGYGRRLGPTYDI